MSLNTDLQTLKTNIECVKSTLYTKLTNKGVTNIAETDTLSTLADKVATITVGEGGSGGALALVCGVRVWMLENSVYSILSPEGFASILLKDATKAKEVAETMSITSFELLEKGVIEKIIKELSSK